MKARYWSRIAVSLLLFASLGASGEVAWGTGSGSAVEFQQSREPLWLPPVGFSLEVAAPFRAPTHRYGAGHRGFDLAAQPGEAVFSPASGTVTFAGRVVDRDVISVRVSETTVLSIEPITSGLAPGDAVARGDVLGEVSTGGHCTGHCVHLGVRIDDGYVNPMRFFRDKPRLLPWDRAAERPSRNR